MKIALFILGASLLISCSSPAQSSQKITLRFVPQEKTGAPVPTLPEYLKTQKVRLVLRDARQLSQKAEVGRFADDEDRPITLIATGNVLEFANEVLRKTARSWGVKPDESACIVLSLELKQFYVRERDWPIGSTYKASARIQYSLTDPFGRTLVSGTASGDAGRYGKSRSADNSNEVLSNALKEAYARLFDKQSLDLKDAEGSSTATDQRTPIEPAALLAELKKLMGTGSAEQLMTAFVEQHKLSAALTAADVAAWKKAGLPEQVIVAALRSAK